MPETAFRRGCWQDARFPLILILALLALLAMRSFKGEKKEAESVM